MFKKSEQLRDMILSNLPIAIDKPCACGKDVGIVSRYEVHRGRMSGIYYVCPHCRSGGYLSDQAELKYQKEERKRRRLCKDKKQFARHF